MSNAQPDLDRFRSDSFEPLSFRERGASVPFTTPLLLNARIRKGSFGQGLEMVLTNPSGGCGALILPWQAMPEICSPTLFDRHLWKSLGEAKDLSPIGIRREAQRLAALGLAGRQAAIAAREAQRREEISRRLAESILLGSLIAETEAHTETNGRYPGKNPEISKKQFELALGRAASVAGLPLVQFVADLEGLIASLSGAIPEMKGEVARLRQVLANLIRITDEITAWCSSERQEGAHILAAEFIEHTARQTIECAQFVLAATDQLIADIGMLLSEWRNEREAIFERARGPDWVLDGWRTPMALWETAAAQDRPMALREMALIAPILPHEAKAWLGQKSAWVETPQRMVQMVRNRADWRSGKILELMKRNENLISISISYENLVTVTGPQSFTTNVVIERTAKRTTTEAPLQNPGQETTFSANGIRAAEAEPRSAKRGTFAEGRVLGNQLATASDETLMRVVAVVDQFANQEVHQRILGPSLRRLRRLRPPRPASLTRLLFLPLSGALVDPLQWRRTEGRIPRTAIAPLMEALLTALGPKAHSLQQQVHGSKMEDTRIVEPVGRILWHSAAEISTQLRPGPNWFRSGLTGEDFAAITGLAAALWRHAGPLWIGMRDVAGASPPERLHEALVGPASEGRLVFVAALGALLQRAASPSVFVTLLKEMPQNISVFVEELLHNWIGAVLPELPLEDFATGARIAAEIGVMINALEELPPSVRRIDAKEVVAHRRDLGVFCLNAYRDVVSIHLIQTLLNLRCDRMDDLSRIEAMARIARILEDTGRRFGAPQRYNALQEEFRTQVERWSQNAKNPPAASAIDIARIEEILIGQDAAERFLHRARLRDQKAI